MLQRRGFNAFSFRDLAAATGIKSASVHYYFPTKQDLGIELVRDYAAAVAQVLDGLDHRADLSPEARLRAFFDLFSETAATGDRICLVGMLASDFETLGEGLRAEVRGFFTMVESWLARQLGALNRSLRPAERRRLAGTAMAALEGALLASRLFAQPNRVGDAGDAIIEMVKRAKP
jgi:TetR/AcrR family transcriptional repressor of nem operon